MAFPDALTKEDIERGQLPLLDILEKSCYYPASEFDGRVIKCCNTLFSDWGISSFIYCDYNVAIEKLIANQETFLGYFVFASRSVRPEAMGLIRMNGHIHFTLRG